MTNPTTTHDAETLIRQKLDGHDRHLDFCQWVTDATSPCHCPDGPGYDELDSAIRAVLDLHTERNGFCTGCENDDSPPLSYPCPTIRTIADKLGITLSTATKPRVN